MGLIVLLPSLMISASFMKAPSGLGNGISREHHLCSQYLGYDHLAICELSIPPKYSDESRINGLRLVEEISCSIEEKSLVEFETNLFKFLNVGEMFNKDRRFIINVDAGYFHGWNNLNNG